MGRSAGATGHSWFAASLQRVQVLDATMQGLKPRDLFPQIIYYLTFAFH